MFAKNDPEINFALDAVRQAALLIQDIQAQMVSCGSGIPLVPLEVRGGQSQPASCRDDHLLFYASGGLFGRPKSRQPVASLLFVAT